MKPASRTLPLTAGWQLARTPPGAVTTPAELAAPLQWHDAEVPGTVAGVLHRDLDTAGRYDADDWWYRTTFANSGTDPFLGRRQSGLSPNRVSLRFDGLATIAEVWLNGTRILTSDNMFRARCVDVTGLLKDVNQLAIRFLALESALTAKKPRARWKTRLAEPANLRGVRTTLLGRMPGWTPAVAPVGPWRGVSLVVHEAAEICQLDLQARAEGPGGRIKLRADIDTFGAGIGEARLTVGEHVFSLDVNGDKVSLDAVVPEAPLWWPHTHGSPRLLDWKLDARIGGHWVALDAGRLGFRDVAMDWSGGGARLSVNGVPVFCRGAVWTPLDIVRLSTDEGTLRAALVQARDAGLNMLRLAGNTAYECDAFYAICDELGILVWQDFMFANFDYPLDDADFRLAAEGEVRHQLSRLRGHPCIAIYCGGSETAQQAAMMGLPPERWSHAFFTETVPKLVEELHSGVPYVPATPWGGALPFHVGTGVAHYYGVGAYLRPLADARQASVRFAAECLAFANVPEHASLEAAFDTATPAPHHPRWKSGVPRDNGAGWDFDDVRDHYLRVLFGEDPVALRSRDLERYFALSRVVSGEVMRRTFAEWRRGGSPCGGALVWTMRDVRPGAGSGVVDVNGMPKAAYWYLKRAWATQAVHLTDEGLDGYTAHVVNDSPGPLDARLELVMLREGRQRLVTAARELQVAPWSTTSMPIDAMVGQFTDATHAYRFGRAMQDVVAVRLVRPDGFVLSEDVCFPAGHELPRQHAGNVKATAAPMEDGRVAMTIETDAFLQSLSIDCPGFTPDDNHFHVVPGWTKRVVLAPSSERLAFCADMVAINREGRVAVTLPRRDATRNPESTEGPRRDAGR